MRLPPRSRMCPAERGVSRYSSPKDLLDLSHTLRSPVVTGQAQSAISRTTGQDGTFVRTPSLPIPLLSFSACTVTQLQNVSLQVAGSHNTDFKLKLAGVSRPPASAHRRTERQSKFRVPNRSGGTSFSRDGLARSLHPHARPVCGISFLHLWSPGEIGTVHGIYWYNNIQILVMYTNDGTKIP